MSFLTQSSVRLPHLVSRWSSSVSAQALRSGSNALLMGSMRPFGAAAASGSGLPRQEITDRVVEVVKKFDKVDPAKVSPNSHFSNDLGLDSLDTVEVVMALEDEFAIEIPDADAEKINSCDDAVNYISSKSDAK